MSEAKFTPGPWDWACDSYGKVQHSRKYDCVYTVERNPGGDRIVTLAARIPRTADARLIAKAPELVTALATIIDERDRAALNDADPAYLMIDHAIEKARALLAEIEGKANDEG